MRWMYRKTIIVERLLFNNRYFIDQKLKLMHGLQLYYSGFISPEL